jgi:hypothetical protein
MRTPAIAPLIIAYRLRTRRALFLLRMARALSRHYFLATACALFHLRFAITPHGVKTAWYVA